MKGKEQWGISDDAPYFQHAHKLWKIGLCPIPCGGENGKRPLCNWKGFQRYKPYEKVVERWVDNHKDGNIGIVTGALYNLTVIDFDYSISCEEIFDLYGHSPIVIETPRGGKHAYYSYNGEGTGSLGENIDIRGNGGLIIAPPSKSLINGNPYNFIFGGWKDVLQLPPIKQTASTELIGIKTGEEQVQTANRNNFLFQSLLRVAHNVRSKQALIDVAHEINVFNYGIDALPPTEVESTAKSVWKYVKNGTLFTPEQHGIKLLKQDILNRELSDREFRLLAILKLYHFEGGKRFAVCPEAMEEMMGCTAKPIRDARNGLIQKGYLLRTHKGGRSKGDPALFKLSAKAVR